MAKDYLLTFLSTGQQGEQYANTVCIHDDELGGARSPADAVGHMDSWLRSAYKDVLHQGTKLNVLRAFQIPAVYGTPTDVAISNVDQYGTIGPVDGKLPREMTLTLSFRGSSTSRRRMGRISLPSPEHGSYIDGSGEWLITSAYWLKAAALGDTLLAGHDIGIGGIDGHMSLRVYSRKTHIEGGSPKTFDVNAYQRRRRPRWVRRRVSIP